MANGSLGLGETALSSGFKNAHEFKFRPQSVVKENILPQKNPDMGGRATPLERNPADERVEKDLRNSIQSDNDDAMTKKLLEMAGIKAPMGQEIKKDIPKVVKKSQGIWAQILEWFKNIFK